MNTSKYVDYTPLPGSTITEAAVKAIRLAQESTKDVMLTFNDASIVVKANQRAQDVVEAYREKRAEIHQAYRATPAGLGAKSEQDATAADLSKVVSELVAALPETLELGLTETIKWVQQYSIAADNIATDPQAAKVLSAFKLAGYQTDEFSGDKFIPNNKEVFGRYIVGQVMLSLQENGRPHPVADSFAKKYLALPEDPSKPTGGRGSISLKSDNHVEGVRTRIVRDTKYWYLNDRLHREGEPAVEGPLGFKEWYLNGKRHNENGPAVVDHKGGRQWWIDGTKLTEEDFLKRQADAKAAALRDEAAGNFFQVGTRGTGTVIRPNRPKP